MTWLNRVITRLRRRALHEQRGFALLLTLGLMGFFAVSVVALLGLTLNMAGLSTLQAGQAKNERAASSAIDSTINDIRSDSNLGVYPSADCGAIASGVTYDDITPTVDCVPLESQADNVPTDPTRSMKLIGVGSYGGGPSLVASVDALRVVGNASVKGTSPGSIRVSGTYSQGEQCLPASDVVATTKLCVDPVAGGLDDSDEFVPAGAASWTSREIGSPPLMPTIPACNAGGEVAIGPGAYTRALTKLLNERLACGATTFHFEPGVYWFDADDGAAGDLRNALVLDKAGTRFIFGTKNAAGDGCDSSEAGVDITLSSQSRLVHGSGAVSICGTVRQVANPSMPETITPVGAVENVPEPPIGCSFDPAANSFSNPDLGLPGPGTARAVFSLGPGFDIQDENCYRDSAALKFSLPDLSLDPDVPINTAVVHIVGGVSFGNGNTAQTVFDVALADGTTTCSISFPHISDSDGELAYDLLRSQGTCDEVLESRHQLSSAKITVRYRIHAFPYDTDQSYPDNAGAGCAAADASNPNALAVKVCAEIDSVTLSAGWVLSASSATNVGGGARDWGDPTAALDRGGPAAYLGVEHPTVLATFSTMLTGFDFGRADPFVPSTGVGGLGVMVTGQSDGMMFPEFPIQSTTLVPGASTPFGETYIVAKLSWPGGSCGAMVRQLPLWGEAVFIDLLRPQEVPSTLSQCQSADFANAAALRDTSLAVEVRSANLSSTPGVPIFGKYSFERIDAVELVVQPGSPYTYPARPNEINGSSFSVTGSVDGSGGLSIPHNDLRVDWAGTLADEDRPVVDGSLVANSLTSTQSAGAEVGVICCEVGVAAERVVELTASIDSEKYVQAVFRIADHPGLGVAVHTSRWTVCRLRPTECPP